MNAYTIIYSLVGNVPCGVIRNEDGAWIPMDEHNTDYQAYVLWKVEQETTK